MERVAVYVDGFNLYFGMKHAGWRKYYWLDLPALARNLLKPNQELVDTHYFTTRIRHNGRNAADAQRQNAYLDALVECGVKIQYGHYLEKQRTCRKCQATWPDYEEKMTDVNIAVQLLSDAFDNSFDVALVISGDSDLTTPINRVRQRFPGKRVVVAFPPNRHSSELKRYANGFLTIGEDKLRNSQLPDQVPTARGHVLQRPAHWQ